jgi:nucleoside-diphosphate-sugar epimerase
MVWVASTGRGGATTASLAAALAAAVDVPHSYTAVADAAAALVRAARDERSWGRAWHAPVIVRSVREVATRLAELRGVPEPRLAVLTDRERSLLGFTDPIWNEFWETDYMSHRPFVVDASRIEATFGLTASPLDEAL